MKTKSRISASSCPHASAHEKQLVASRLGASMVIPMPLHVIPCPNAKHSNPSIPIVLQSQTQTLIRFHAKCLHRESLPQPSTSHSYIPHPLGPKAVRTSLLSSLDNGSKARDRNVWQKRECRIAPGMPTAATTI